MNLKWTHHGVIRGRDRLGRYGKALIEKRVIENVHKAEEAGEDCVSIPFKLGRKHCVAILAPLTDDGLTAKVITVYEDLPAPTYDEYVGKRLRRYEKKQTGPLWIRDF